MRIIFQGSMSPEQMAKAVNEIVNNTIEKMEAKPQEQALQNVVIEMNLNVEGYDKPQLLVDDETGIMFTVHTGIKDGELTEYVEPDRTELLEKFNEMVTNVGEEEKTTDGDLDGEMIIDGEFTEVEEENK